MGVLLARNLGEMISVAILRGAVFGLITGRGWSCERADGVTITSSARLCPFLSSLRRGGAIEKLT
jgi:hypothetical protein